MNNYDKKPDSVIIASGGLDSTTLLYYMVRKLGLSPIVLSFLYGQKHKKELDYLTYHIEILKNSGAIIKYDTIAIESNGGSMFSASSLVNSGVNVLDSETNKPTTYVPNRNGIMLSIAAAVAENNDIHEIYYGAQKQDTYHYWDTTEEFTQSFNGLLESNDRHQLTVLAPFVNMSKSEVVKIALDLEVDISKTWSCYNGGEKPCGICHTCVERNTALKNNGIEIST